MMVIGYNAMQASGNQPTEAAIGSKYSDKEAVSDYAAGKVGGLIGAGLISGIDENSISPATGATRAQSCKFVCMMMDYKK